VVSGSGGSARQQHQARHLGQPARRAAQVSVQDSRPAPLLTHAAYSGTSTGRPALRPRSRRRRRTGRAGARRSECGPGKNGLIPFAAHRERTRPHDSVPGSSAVPGPGPERYQLTLAGDLQTLQGEGGSRDLLLQQTADLAKLHRDKDQVIATDTLATILDAQPSLHSPNSPTSSLLWGPVPSGSPVLCPCLSTPLIARNSQCTEHLRAS